MDLTQTLSLALWGIVRVEAALALSAMGAVWVLVARNGWKKEYVVYLYEIGLLALYGHFIIGTPVGVSKSFYSVFYWSALLGTGPLVVMPLMLEWRELADMYAEKRRRPFGKMKRLVIVMLFCITVIAIAAGILGFTLRQMEALQRSL